METVEKTGFEHKGFKCTITERPDLFHLFSVHGYRKSDNKDWSPNLLFEQYITAEEIKKACIDIIDGTFSGKVERCGNYNVMVG